MMRRISTLLFFFLALVEPARAASGGETLALTGFSSSYTNLKLGSNPNNTSVESVAPSVDVELALRGQSVFSFFVSWTHFSDPDPNDASQLPYTADGFGLGIKIDLPGFFFVGKSSANRGGKQHPVNTYLFGEVIKFFLTDISDGVKVSTTAARDGLGVDIFPFNQTAYVALRVSLLNLLGATYVSYSWGLGFSF